MLEMDFDEKVADQWHALKNRCFDILGSSLDPLDLFDSIEDTDLIEDVDAMSALMYIEGAADALNKSPKELLDEMGLM